MKDIYYIGFYDIIENGVAKRKFPLAAAKKIEFITQTIRDLGYCVHIISPISVKNKEFSYRKTEKKMIGENIDVVFPASWYGKNKISSFICRIWIKFWLWWYLLNNLKRNDIIIVYHNYVMALPIYLAQKIRGFHIILEIEELFSNIWNIGWLNRMKEKLMLSFKNDHSLVVSEVLAESLSIKHPIISYGGYLTIEPLYFNKENGKDILLIYTGSIDKIKMSAYQAVRCMMFLPTKYKLKITGHVTQGEEEYFANAIEEVNQMKGMIQIEYLGILDNLNYNRLLNKADIALNPQQDGDFGRFLFPSKILTYLSHGLPVVSTKGESIIRSQLSDIIVFAKDFSPKSFAKTIMKIHPKDKRFYIERVNQLAKKFKFELGSILETM